MVGTKKVREPKLPFWFRRLLAPLAARITARRVYGLANRRGIVPQGPVSADTKIEYYTDKDQRKTEKVDLLDLEAKSAPNDRILKYFGTAIFVAMVLASVLCVGLDEVRAVLFPAASEYRIGNVVSVGAAVGVAYLILFGWMQQKFERMDQSWANNIDSFFGGGARSQMEAITNCMREFKRFVKWRRYMRLMMGVAILFFLAEAIFIFVVPDTKAQAEIAKIVVAMISGRASAEDWKLLWSETEVYFAIWFFTAQIIWFMIYWYMWLYYTSFRDPTLQMCVVLNAIDRETVPPPQAAERR